MGRGAESGNDIDTLRKNVEWALRNSPEASEVLPLLVKLARSAEPESEAWLLAHRHIAEIAVDRDPWRAALFARRVVRVDADDDGAWSVLGLAQTLLGNYRAAATAYRRAIAIAPENPWYAHNLGHLLDVALDQTAEALVWLAGAHKREPNENEIAASYAHALARSGKLAVAKKMFRSAVTRGATKEQLALWRWLDEGVKRPRKTTKKKASPSKAKKKAK